MKFNKKGITLVETILTILVLSIVLTAIGVALSSYGGQYKNMAQRLKAQESASLIAEKIELSVRYAGSAIISDSEQASALKTIINKGGKLWYVPNSGDVAKPEEYVEKAGYNGLNCNVIFSKAGDNSITAEIIMYKGTPTEKGTDEVPNDDYLYKVTRTIKLLNTAYTGGDASKSTISSPASLAYILKYN